jgi:DNA-binding CsgD family transcriptional regulator
MTRRTLQNTLPRFENVHSDSTLSYDVLCGVPAIGSNFISRLEFQGLTFDEQATTKLIVDIHRGYALQTLRALADSSLRLVVVTYSPCPEYWEDIWDLQPSVLIVDPPYRYDFSDALRKAANGARYRQMPSASTPLSRSERQVLARVAEGLSNKQIAQDLNFQEKTVLNMLTGIYAKLDLQNRTHALLYYWGLASNTTQSLGQVAP